MAPIRLSTKMYFDRSNIFTYLYANNLHVATPGVSKQYLLHLYFTQVYYTWDQCRS